MKQLGKIEIGFITAIMITLVGCKTLHSSEDLFSSVYYPDPGTTVNHNETSQTIFDLAMVDYKEGAYIKALPFFLDECPFKAPDDAICQYYLAQCFLQMYQYQRAIQIFEKISSKGESEWSAKAEWYLCYAYYQLGDDKYEALLSKIASSPKHPFHNEATAISPPLITSDQ